ncbi:MAG: glycoside hydrolase family 3 C-terminal domain-containing protein [Clostridiales Family XIII bacterium]|jgi:beta-glucosidase|nr:glycoside hydrolase family 3 C-terminal domain-containing protein [Clostridiales Family XIII bacterium]
MEDKITAVYARAVELVEKMTLREKAALCSGRGYWHTKAVKRLGLRPIMLADGPHGLRKQGRLGSAFGIGGSTPATCFPTASLTACSFDRELIREIGEAIAEEAADQGVSIVLGPGVNIKRGPLGGRNFEYFSEDPYLSGEFGAAFVRGVQGGRVGACVKHFAANSQETNRMVSDSVMDDGVLRNIYLPAFEKVVKEAQPAAVMCSYNKLNGTYASENKYLLTDILRGEWGYRGAVMSDWGATSDRALGLAAGLDLEMPGSGWYSTREIMRAVKSGRLSEADLSRAVARVAELALEYPVAQQQGTAGVAPAGKAGSPSGARGVADDMYERHHALARRAAAESAVLLKNEGGALPIAPGAKVAVIGEFARSPRYQGSGSSRVNPVRLDCAWDELRRDFPDAVFAPGYALHGRGADGAGASHEPRAESGSAYVKDSVPPKARTLIDEAVRAADEADAAVVFAGLPEEYESEGFDRESLAMPPEHGELIRAVCAANRNTVVVVQAGAPVDLSPAAGAAAILYAYLGGQAGGGAIADVLTGRVNPSGRLAETFPVRLEDTPCHGNFGTDRRLVEYEENDLVGYRHYEAMGIPVAYPFGHGLSYTTFAHSKETATDIGGGVKRVSVTVTNTGSRAGAETVLFYGARAPGTLGIHGTSCGRDALDIPRRALCGFGKTFLQPGESATVSADIADIKEGSPPSAPGHAAPPHSADVAKTTVSANNATPPTRARFGQDSTLGDIKRTPAGFVCCFAVRLILTLIYGTGASGRRMVRAIVDETPLRTISSMSGGLFPRPLVNALVALANLRHGVKYFWDN